MKISCNLYEAHIQFICSLHKIRTCLLVQISCETHNKLIWNSQNLYEIQMNICNYDFICTWYWMTHKGHRTNQTWRIMMNNTWRTRLLYFSDTFLPRNFCWKGNLGHLIENKCGYQCISSHVDVIKWKHFPRYWPFVRGIHRSPVNSPHKGQWHGALMFSLIFVWINDWVNNREAGDLRRYHTHYDVTVMRLSIIMRARPYMAVFVFGASALCVFCAKCATRIQQMLHQNPMVPSESAVHPQTPVGAYSMKIENVWK